MEGLFLHGSGRPGSHGDYTTELMRQLACETEGYGSSTGSTGTNKEEGLDRDM